MSKQKHRADKALGSYPENEYAKPDTEPETRDRLKELDHVDVEFGDQFYDRMHDQIMSRIEERAQSSGEQPTISRRKQASSLNLVRPVL